MTGRLHTRAKLLGAGGFVAGSLVLHLLCIAFMSRAKLEPARQAPVEIELSIVSVPAKAPESEPARQQRVEPAPVRASAELRHTRDRVEPRRRADAVAVAAPQNAETSATDARLPSAALAAGVEQPPPSAAEPRGVASGRAIDLSPHRAVASLIDSLDLPIPVCTDRTSGRGLNTSCESSDQAVSAQQMLDRSLQQARTPLFLAKREPPALHRQGDGSYRYDGHVFSATIRDDGQVEFADGAPVHIDGPATIGIGIAGGFDLTDAVEHGVLGKELYSSEKRWFLDQTAQLRGKLTAAARIQERARDKRELERVLERILAAPALDAAHKRERVLALWEDCEGDAESADMRRVVETFVRMHMPAGSALAFSREELERWNRGRTGVRFEPYES